MPRSRLVLAAGPETSRMSPGDARKSARETAMWAKVVKSTGIKVE
jgi:hypothetical protein